jgi:hypothetical protein
MPATAKPLADECSDRGHHRSVLSHDHADRSHDREGVLFLAPRPKDSGFALLLVFLMASLIAISLYMELPRVAFQAERQKEQLLIEHGEQYKRAIGLFLRTNKNARWPASIEELESYNNHRSLRKRYIDPMTGKDEWRLIHIQNGVLQDSVTNKKTNNNANQQAGLSNDGFITELQGLGQQAADSQATNPALRRRASDGGSAPLGPDGQPLPNAPTGFTGTYPGVPPAPGYGPPGFVLPGAAGAQGAPNGVGIPGLLGIPTVPGAGPAGAIGGIGSGNSPLGSVPGTQPTVPGAPPGFSPGLGGAFSPGLSGPQSSGPQGSGQPGVQINPQAQAAAAGLLQNLLTQPRPGGLAGITSAGPGGAIMGGGIAGVASKAEGESIMVYGDRTDFSEWEFIYDPMKFRVPANPNTGSGAGGVPASQLASNAGTSSPGTPIGTGPGGTQVAGPSGAGGGVGGVGSAGGVGGAGSVGGAGAGPASFGQSSSQSSQTGASGATGAGGSTPPAGGGSTAFGQAGGPDIRPGKK